MIKKSGKHNKYYYEEGRNGWTPNNTWQEEVIEDKDNKWIGGTLDARERKDTPVFSGVLKIFSRCY